MFSRGEKIEENEEDVEGGGTAWVTLMGRWREKKEETFTSEVVSLHVISAGQRGIAYPMGVDAG